MKNFLLSIFVYCLFVYIHHVFQLPASSGFRFRDFYLPVPMYSEDYKIREKMQLGSPHRSQEAYEIWAFSAEVNNSYMVGMVRKEQ